MMYWAGIWLVHCPCPYNVLTVYQVGKLGFVPSVSSSYNTASESGLDPLPDYDEDEAGVCSVPGGPLVGERPPALC